MDILTQENKGGIRRRSREPQRGVPKLSKIPEVTTPPVPKRPPPPLPDNEAAEET